MILFFILICLTIFFSIWYLLNFKKNKKSFLFFFLFIFATSFSLYNFKGNKSSFSYTYEVRETNQRINKRSK